MRYQKLIYVFVLLTIQLSFSQYQLKRSVIGNGVGHVGNADYTLKSILGQPATGIMSNNIYINYVGFWYHGDFFVPIVDDTFQQSPQKFELFQNYPNPFNPSTTIRFSLPEAGQVKLELYTLLGKRVTTLLDEYKTPGVYEVHFDAAAFSTGFYIYRIKAGRFKAVKKMIYTK